MDAKIVFSSFEQLKIQDVSFTDPIRPNVIVVGDGPQPIPIKNDIHFLKVLEKIEERNIINVSGEVV